MLKMLVVFIGQSSVDARAYHLKYLTRLTIYLDPDSQEEREGVTFGKFHILMDRPSDIINQNKWKE